MSTSQTAPTYNNFVIPPALQWTLSAAPVPHVVRARCSAGLGVYSAVGNISSTFTLSRRDLAQSNLALQVGGPVGTTTLRYGADIAINDAFKNFPSSFMSLQVRGQRCCMALSLSLPPHMLMCSRALPAQSSLVASGTSPSGDSSITMIYNLSQPADSLTSFRLSSKFLYADQTPTQVGGVLDGLGVFGAGKPGWGCQCGAKGPGQASETVCWLSLTARFFPRRRCCTTARPPSGITSRASTC